MATMSFATFVFNPGYVYLQKTDHIALMIGYIAMVYLTSIFVSSDWIYSTIGHCLSSVVVILYFGRELEYNVINIGPAVLLLMISGGFITYYVELKDKLEFLEKN